MSELPFHRERADAKVVLPLSLAQLGEFDVLIDARSPSEYAEDHLPDAINIPLSQLLERSRSWSHRERIITVCAKGGGRSAQACNAFVKAGFDNVVNIEGGTLAWVAAGLPVNRGTKKMISLERQVRIVSGLLIVAGTVLAATISSWFLVIPGSAVFPPDRYALYKW